MSVVLLILKIIGLILLILLGIALFLLSIVLFVPVRYEIQGKIEEEIAIYGKITWLLHIVSLSFSYEGEEIDHEFRLFGFLRRQKKAALEEETEDFENSQDFEDEKETGFLKIPDNREESSRAVQESKRLNAESTETSHTKGHEHKESVFDKIKFFWKQFKYMILHLGDFISNIKDNMLEEANRIAAKTVLGELIYLLKHFRFRRINTELEFSMGDPALTGQALGILCMVPILYQYNFHIYPDFEAEELYVKGTFDVKGRMRGVHVVRSLVKAFRQKECRVLLGKIMNRNER